jgi:uncharacterized protein
MNPLPDEVVQLLRCPITRSKLRQSGEWLVSEEGTKYAVRDGIPVLLPEEAKLPDGVASIDELKARGPR